MVELEELLQECEKMQERMKAAFSRMQKSYNNLSTANQGAEWYDLKYQNQYYDFIVNTQRIITIHAHEIQNMAIKFNIYHDSQNRKNLLPNRKKNTKGLENLQKQLKAQQDWFDQIRKPKVEHPSESNNFDKMLLNINFLIMQLNLLKQFPTDYLEKDLLQEISQAKSAFYDKFEQLELEKDLLQEISQAKSAFYDKFFLQIPLVYEDELEEILEQDVADGFLSQEKKDEILDREVVGYEAEDNKHDVIYRAKRVYLGGSSVESKQAVQPASSASSSKPKRQERNKKMPSLETIPEEAGEDFDDSINLFSKVDDSESSLNNSKSMKKRQKSVTSTTAENGNDKNTNGKLAQAASPASSAKSTTVSVNDDTSQKQPETNTVPKEQPAITTKKTVTSTTVSGNDDGAESPAISITDSDDSSAYGSDDDDQHQSEANSAPPVISSSTTVSGNGNDKNTNGKLAQVASPTRSPNPTTSTTVPGNGNDTSQKPPETNTVPKEQPAITTKKPELNWFQSFIYWLRATITYIKDKGFMSWKDASREDVYSYHDKQKAVEQGVGQENESDAARSVDDPKIKNNMKKTGSSPLNNKTISQLSRNK